MSQDRQRIAVSKLSFAYPDGKPLLHELSFELYAPAFHALFGRSGVGKTTLAKIICGMENGWSGTASFPERVLYCHCTERLPRWQTIGSHLQDVISPHKRHCFTQLMTSFGLDKELLAQRPTTLSSGQHNRFNVLRYLLQEFDLLILDEALNNVDEPTRLAILAAIKTMYPDRAFLYISHQLFDVISFAKTLLILRSGAQGPQIVTRQGLNLAEYKPNEVAGLAGEIWTVINNA